MTKPAPPDTAAITSFWQSARRLYPDAVHGDSFRIRALGDTPEMMNSILGHVLRGEKKGTFALPWLHAKDPSATPRIGDYVVLVDYEGRPAALVTTTQLENVTFDTISGNHTALDGPRMRDPAAWKTLHQAFWTKQLAAAGLQFSKDRPVVVEHFELLHPLREP